MGMDDYGDEDEVQTCFSSFFSLTGKTKQIYVLVHPPPVLRLLCGKFTEFSGSLVSFLLLGLAGVDGQNQRETGEEHQTASTGGQTRQRS